MTFLTRKTLTRRTMLKGMGASVALPLLDSMMPALSAQQTGSKQAPMRLGFVYAAHGIIHSEWKPRQTGRQYSCRPTCSLLQVCAITSTSSRTCRISKPIARATAAAITTGPPARGSPACMPTTARVRAPRSASRLRPIR